MIFEEPRVEFVPIEATDIAATSGGAGVDFCAPGNANDEKDFPCYGNDN